MRKKDTLSNALKYTYGLGDVLFSFSVSFKVYYWSYFLTSVVALPLAAIGVMNTVINVFDLIMTFFWGAILDSIRPGKWGKYRTIMLVFAPLIVITHTAQWFAPTAYTFGASANTAIILTILTYCLYVITFNIPWVASYAIPNLVCSNEKERSQLNGTKTILNGVRNLVLAQICVWLINMWKDPVIGYAMAATITGLLTIPGYMYHAWLIKDYEWTPAEMAARGMEYETKDSKSRVKLLDTIKVLLSNSQVLWTVIINTCNQFVNSIFSYLGVYLFEMVLNAPEQYAMYISLTSFSSIVGAFIANILTTKVANKTIAQVSLIVQIVALIFVDRAAISGSATMFTIMMIIVKLAMAITVPALATFYSNCAVYEEWKTGVNKTGSIMGTSNIAIKIALTSVGILIPALLAATGYVAGAPITAATVSGLAHAYGLVPAAINLVCLLLLTFFYKLDRKTIDQYLVEIEQRKADAVK